LKAFIDTSSLLKKYITEEGSDTFDHLLEEISEIIVAPFCLLELHSAIRRLLKEKRLTENEALQLLKETRQDILYFSRIHWNDNLEQEVLELIQKYQLKTLDSLQLACGYLSQSDMFITSDEKLYHAAKKELNNVKLIL